jgi:hypothetical protein
MCAARIEGHNRNCKIRLSKLAMSYVHSMAIHLTGRYGETIWHLAVQRTDGIEVKLQMDTAQAVDMPAISMHVVRIAALITMRSVRIKPLGRHGLTGKISI